MKKLIVAIVFLSLCLGQAASGAVRDKTALKVARLNRYSHRRGYSQKGAFRYKRNAEDFSHQLRQHGFKVFIVKGVTSHDRKIYRVIARETTDIGIRDSRFVKVKRGKSSSGLKSFDGKKDGSKNASSSGISSGGSTDLPKGAFLVSDAGQSGVPGTERQEERPLGTLKTYRQIFGRGGSHFHPSLAVTEIYTDNAFATKDNRKSNLSTIITPEIWLSFPRVAERRLVLDDTANRMPGGLVFTSYAPEVKRRYQTYLLYRADIPLPSANSPYGNSVSHTGFGKFEFNGNKFSGDVYDLFIKSFETRSTNVATTPGEIDRFYNNLFKATAHVDTGNRLRFRVDYSNFLVHYNDERNRFMDRTDNSIDGYLYYKFQPKTAAFLEYRYIDLSYVNDSDLDSTEHHFLAGVQWDITAKSQGIVKAGYGIKDFTNSSQRVKTFIAEAQIKHRFTPRTSVTLTGFRTTDETNLVTSPYTVTNQVGAKYEQLLTSKITGIAELLYINEKYEDVMTAGTTSTIEDNVYQASIGMQYEFQKWLRSSMGYTYTRRDSPDPDFGFVSNTVFFRVTGSL